MNWKEWPYWVKGGVIGLIIGILSSISAPMYTVLALMLIGGALGFGAEGQGYFIIISGLTLIFLFFVIGALIGWIYERYKK
ncbi:hypothetical protein ACFLZZ_00710 [Nanoarchaeota archaeon]